ncbi:hypothetical protein Tco_0057569 [Tanacetum coccineum]
MEEINNFQQEPDETLYQAWERFKELLMKCPQHYLTKMQEVILFYNGLDVPTRQILDSRGAVPTKTAADAKTAIQEMAEYSQKWHNGTSRGRSTKTSDGLAAIQAQLNNLGREIKKVNEKVYAAQVGCEQCKGPHYTKDCPQKEEGKTLEEAYYTSNQYIVSTGQNSTPLYKARQTTVPFASRLYNHYCEEEGNYGLKFTETCGASHINNVIPRKEKDPGSFTLPCFINDFCFDNALVDLGASDFAVLENMDAYRDEGMGRVIFGGKLQAYKNSLKTLEKQKRVLQTNQLTLEDKIRVLSSELENTTNLLKYSKKVNAEMSLEKQDLQAKLENERTINDPTDLDESQMTYGPKQTYTSDSEPKTIDLDSCESNSSVESLESMPKHVFNEPARLVNMPLVSQTLSAESPEFFPKSVCARNESVGKADNPRKNNKSPRGYTSVEQLKEGKSSKLWKIFVPAVSWSSSMVTAVLVASVCTGRREVRRVAEQKVRVVDDIGSDLSKMERSFPTGRYVVPTGRVIATVSIKDPTGRYIVPPGYIICPGLKDLSRAETNKLSFLSFNWDLPHDLTERVNKGDGMGVEIAASDIREDEEEFEAEASAGVKMEIVVGPLVTGKISESTGGDAPDLEGTLYDIVHYMSEVPLDRITEFETAQRQLEAGQLMASGEWSGLNAGIRRLG